MFEASPFGGGFGSAASIQDAESPLMPVHSLGSSSAEPDSSSQGRRRYKRKQKVMRRSSHQSITDMSADSGAARTRSTGKTFDRLCPIFKRLVSSSQQQTAISKCKANRQYINNVLDRHKMYRDQNLSFADLAKRIGEDWRDLEADAKNEYLTLANEEWDAYRKRLEQDKIRQISADSSPQSAAYHHALTPVNSQLSNRVRHEQQPPSASSTSSFSVASPIRNTSHPSAESVMFMNAHAPHSGMHGGTVQNQHDPRFVVASQMYPTPIQNMPPQVSSPENDASSFTWPMYPGDQIPPHLWPQ